MKRQAVNLDRAKLWAVAVAGFVLRLLLVFRDPVMLSIRPFQDDAFYLLTCARNLTRGYGLSADQHTLTNGVQPLVVLLYAPLFWIAGSDRWLGVRFALAVSAIIDLYSLWIIWKVLELWMKDRQSQLQAAQFMAAVAWSLLYSTMVHTMNGLETGIYSACLLTVLLQWSRTELTLDGEPRNYVKLGVLLGLSILARIDAALLVPCLGLYHLWSRRGSMQAIRNAAIISITAFAVSSPWWIYNARQFHSLVPVSGQVESSGSTLLLNLLASAEALGDIASYAFYTPFNTYSLMLIVCWLIVGLLFVIWLIRVTHFRERLLWHSGVLAPWILFCAILVLYYTFLFSAPHFIKRYYQPIRILWLLVACSSLPEVWGATLKRSWRLIGVFGFVFLLAALSFNVISYLKCFTLRIDNPAYRIGVWAAERRPSLVGTSSSGTAGFVADNVRNLDGKVNYPAWEAIKADRLGAYCAREAIEYIAEHDRASLDSIASQARAVGFSYALSDTFDGFYIYRKSAIRP